MFTAIRYALILTVTAMAIVITGGNNQVQGQTTGLRAQYIADYETMSSKFSELSEAMDSNMYDWQPMADVRTVSEVFMLIVAENYLMPSSWGATAPSNVTVSGAMFEEMATITDKDEVLAHLEQSFDYVISAMGDISDEQMNETIQFFGQETTVQAALFFIVVDMHEHLGQAIAYARANNVVPPWSARQNSGN